MQLRDLSIKRKLMLLTTLISTLALFVASTGFVAYDLLAFRRQMSQDLMTQAEIVGSNSAAALVFQDVATATEILSALKAREGIVAAALYTTDGELFADYYRAGRGNRSVPPRAENGGHRFDGDRLRVFQSVELRGQTLGTVYLESDMQQWHSRFSRYTGIVGVLMCGSALLALVLSSRLQRVISGPILRLEQTMREVSAEKSFSVRAVKSQNDEVGSLIDGFNAMLAEIQERDAALQQANRSLTLRTQELEAEAAERKRAQEELTSLNLTLERRVAERSAAAEQRAHALVRSEAALKKQTRILQSILDGMSDGVIVADDQGRFILVNPAAEDMLDVVVGDLPGEAWVRRHGLFESDMVTPYPVDRFPLMQAVRGQAVAGNEIFVGRSVAREGKWLSVNATPLKDEEGILHNGVAVFHDITTRKRAEEELLKAKNAAEAANRAKSQFLANMSHELRTPLNGILGMVDVLAHSRLAPDQADGVKTIQQSASVLLGIIDDILDFSKIEAGRLEVERVAVALVDLVEGVCSTLLQVAADEGVELSLCVAPDVPEHVWSDPTRLRQVLYNLIGNAIKFSGGRGGRYGSVSLDVEVVQATPLRLAFRIADNGIGIPPETMSRLFTPFTQAEASTTRRFGGTGLGLAICRRLVDLMDGDIAVESQLGEGSCFTVTLPMEVALDQPVQPLPDLSGLVCILLDRALAIKALRVYLEHGGVRLLSAATSLDAEHTARSAAGADGPVVVIHCADRDRLDLTTLTAPFSGVQAVRHLVIARGGRRRPRVTGPDVVTLDGDFLRRRALLRAVAVAAGRASPDIMHPRSEETLPGKQTPPPTVAEARAKGRLILVAEDDEINQKVILQQFGLLGYAAELAHDGAEALALWRQGHYALLVTDLHMPEMDGYTLAQTIRREEAPGVRIPILALTANAQPSEAQRARAAGVDEYLTKPVALQALRSALETWLPHDHASPRPEVLPEPQETGVGSRAPVVDVAVLKALVGDDVDTLREFLCEYLTSLRQRVGELQAASGADDAQHVAGIAHKLKSASRSVGALALGDLCAELENVAKAGNSLAITQHLARVVPAVDSVEAEIGGLLEANQP